MSRVRSLSMEPQGGMASAGIAFQQRQPSHRRRVRLIQSRFGRCEGRELQTLTSAPEAPLPDAGSPSSLFTRMDSPRAITTPSGLDFYDKSTFNGTDTLSSSRA